MASQLAKVTDLLLQHSKTSELLYRGKCGLQEVTVFVIEQDDREIRELIQYLGLTSTFSHRTPYHEFRYCDVRRFLIELLLVSRWLEDCNYRAIHAVFSKLSQITKRIVRPGWLQMCFQSCRVWASCYSHGHYCDCLDLDGLRSEYCGPPVCDHDGCRLDNQVHGYLSSMIVTTTCSTHVGSILTMEIWEQVVGKPMAELGSDETVYFAFLEISVQGPEGVATLLAMLLLGGVGADTEDRDLMDCAQSAICPNQLVGICSHMCHKAGMDLMRFVPLFAESVLLTILPGQVSVLTELIEHQLPVSFVKACSDQLSGFHPRAVVAWAHRSYDPCCDDQHYRALCATICDAIGLAHVRLLLPLLTDRLDRDLSVSTPLVSRLLTVVSDWSGPQDRFQMLSIMARLQPEQLDDRTCALANRAVCEMVFAKRLDDPYALIRVLESESVSLDGIPRNLLLEPRLTQILQKRHVGCAFVTREGDPCTLQRFLHQKTFYPAIVTTSLELACYRADMEWKFLGDGYLLVNSSVVRQINEVTLNATNREHRILVTDRNLPLQEDLQLTKWEITDEQEAWFVRSTVEMLVREGYHRQWREALYTDRGMRYVIPARQIKKLGLESFYQTKGRIGVQPSREMLTRMYRRYVVPSLIWHGPMNRYRDRLDGAFYAHLDTLSDWSRWCPLAGNCPHIDCDGLHCSPMCSKKHAIGKVCWQRHPIDQAITMDECDHEQCSDPICNHLHRTKMCFEIDCTCDLRHAQGSHLSWIRSSEVPRYQQLPEECQDGPKCDLAECIWAHPPG